MNQRLTLALLLGALASFPLSASAATITIVNNDGAGEGFNQTTAVAPVGGNPGTTIGAQRLNVFNRAATIWGTLLPSAVTIRVQAQFNALSPCDMTSGVLGSAGPLFGVSNFPGAELANTTYAIALANKLAGSDLLPANNDINAQFNTSVDNATCLGATNWYYGYDHNEGTNIDLLGVVLHELGHGLGFLTFASVTDGAFSGGLPDVFSHYLLDTSFGLHWDQMDNDTRASSAINTGKLVWDGPYAKSRAREFLGPYRLVRVDSPAGIAGEKEFGTAQFGPALPTPPISGSVVLVDDGFAPNSDACEQPLVNAAAIAGNIALIDRGVCTFVAKAMAAQEAGAIAVVIANNVAGAPPLMGGEDLGVGIPVVSITQAEGVAIKAQLGTGVTMTLGQDPGRLSGTDAEWRPLMYAPNPVEPGSSVSHWDDSAFPDLLMEPFINPGLTDAVDLTRYVFEDIGWFPRVAGVDGPAAYTLRLRPNAPNPFRTQTAIRFELESPGLLDIEVFDLSGRAVKQVVRSWHPAGPGSAQWDGTDNSGRRVAPGVYLYRMRNGANTETRRMVLAE